MSDRNVSPALLATGNILPSTFVKVDATEDNSGAQAGANDTVIGISGVGIRTPPGIDGASTYHAIDGAEIELFGLGDICLLLAGAGGFVRGDRLKSDATGGGVTIAGAGGNQHIGAIALESAAAAEFGRVQVVFLSLDPDEENDANFADDQPLYFGTGDDAGFEWSTNDASNHAFVMALGDTNEALHITDKGAKDTDWNVSADTHPTVYIHSNTTPATDYLLIGGHDGTTANIDVVGGTTLALKIAGALQGNLTAGGIDLVDDNSFIVGTGLDAEVLWSTGDASDHGVVFALGDTSQMLHITDVGAKASDWAVTSPTHPTVYVHSNTTPITDYLSLGAHDGTTAVLNVAGGSNFQFALSGTTYATIQVTGVAVGTYVAAATPGTDQFTMKSTGTAPVGTGANVGHLYADFETDDDELFWLSGTNGTATQLTT